MRARWLEAVKALPQAPHIARDAMTIAFLVGLSRESLEPEARQRELVLAELENFLRNLIEQMPEQMVGHITRCPLIRQAVLRVVPNGYVGEFYYPVTSAGATRQCLFVDPEYATDGETSADVLAARLFFEFGDALCESRFSFRGGRFQTFNDAERRFAEDCRGI